MVIIAVGVGDEGGWWETRICLNGREEYDCGREVVDDILRDEEV